MIKHYHHEYFGYLICRASINSSGIRWYTWSDKRGFYLKADTLKGIKEMIRIDMKKPY